MYTEVNKSSCEDHSVHLQHVSLLLESLQALSRRNGIKHCPVPHQRVVECLVHIWDRPCRPTRVHLHRLPPRPPTNSWRGYLHPQPPVLDADLLRYILSKRQSSFTGPWSAIPPSGMFQRPEKLIDDPAPLPSHKNRCVRFSVHISRRERFEHEVQEPNRPTGYRDASPKTIRTYSAGLEMLRRRWILGADRMQGTQTPLRGNMNENTTISMQPEGIRRGGTRAREAGHIDVLENLSPSGNSRFPKRSRGIPSS